VVGSVRARHGHAVRVGCWADLKGWKVMDKDDWEALTRILSDWATRGLIRRAPVDDCRHVLWWFGDREYGRQPGHFVEKLLDLAAVADMDNLDRLVRGSQFGIVALWYVAKRGALDEVRNKVIAFELLKSAEFGMPAPEGGAS
jgi:hypothetical protein